MLTCSLDLSGIAYTRNELEAFIGYDNLFEYDVDAIEKEVSRWDPVTRRMVWTVEGEELSRVCMRHHEVNALDVYSQNYDLFVAMSKFGVVHDEYFDCMPGDYLIMYKLCNGSYGVFAKHDSLDGLLLHARDISGMCKYDGTPLEFSYWHLVS